MSWRALFPGWCPNCRTPFGVGDEVAREDGASSPVVHAGCVGVREDDVLPGVRPGEVSCPTCFLIHPEGACDR